MTVEVASEPAFGNLQRQMQRMMDSMQKNFFNFCPSETWTPNVNLYENDTAYLVCVDLAGVDKQKIDALADCHFDRPPTGINGCTNFGNDTPIF